MLNLSLGLQAGQPRSGAPVGPSLQLSLTPFSRDRTLFDSGAAIGQSSASVPLSGSGSAGEIVQARAVSLDDGGATTTAWVDIATTDAGGQWAGALTAPRSPSWFRPEVRLKAATHVVAQGAARFGVGHVLAIWGQSEHEYITSAFYSQTPPVAVADPEAVQLFHGAGGNPQRTLVSDATPLTAAVAAMAATLIAARPGEKFAVVLHAVAGTDPRALVDDGNPGRVWANDRALHDLATVDGQQVGLAGMSWFASPGNLGANYGEALFPLFAATTQAGVPVAIPGTVSHTGGSYHADHWFGELYDYAHTRWVAFGPHRFDIDSDMQDATHLAGGAVATGMLNKQQARQSWRAMATLPAATMFLPATFDPVTYANGYGNGAGGWTDGTHPAPDTDDGIPAFARLNVLAMLRAAGLVSWPVPRFDSCQWDAAGAFVEVWSSAGPVTTTRLARGEPALPPTYPHWTQVAGFQLNGLPAQNATVVAGRVRITPNGGGAFIASDVLTFGEGGATGQVKFPQDQVNGQWKDLPVVAFGLPGLAGIPLVPLPAAAVLANTIPPANPSFTTVSGQSTRFKDTANWPTAGGRLTFAADIKLNAIAAQSYLCEMDNTHVTLSAATDGRLFLALKDSANVSILASTQIGTVTAGTRFDLVVAVDLAALTCWTTLNGVTTARPLGANSGNLASASRKVALLSRAAGTSGFCVATVYKLELWSDCVSGGGRPPADTLLRANGRITGPAATANAHPWKLGGAVV